MTYTKFVFTAMILICILAAMAFSAAVAQEVSGEAYVRDIDTIEVGSVAVRLDGVDGPEMNTRAGQVATMWLDNLLTGEVVTCVLSGEQSYDREIGICFLGDDDIGALAIAAGHALDCPRFSGGRYTHLEQPGALERIGRARYCW